MTESKCGCEAASPSRRAIVTGGLSAGALATLSPELVRAQADPATLRPRAGDLLVRDEDASHTPLGPNDIPLHSPIVAAWALEPGEKIVRKGSRLNSIILLRYEPSELTPETLERAADGVVAYTMICTHNGCDVTEYLPDERVVQCGCHFSKYDTRDSARILDGPAPRPLPALPLKVVDGKLVVAKGYTDRVGFENA